MSRNIRSIFLKRLFLMPSDEIYMTDSLYLGPEYVRKNNRVYLYRDFW